MQRYSYLLIIPAVFVLDRWTKILIGDHLAYLESIRVTTYLNIVHARNMGGAFGILSQHGAGRLVFLVVPLIIISGLAWYVLFKALPFLQRFSLTFVLAGAIGNIYDRIAYGYVVDFIDFSYKGYSWPAFNVADMAITFGIGLWLCCHIFGQKTR
jgi:signal peptidase II